MKPGQFSLTNLTVLRPLRRLVEPFWVPSCDERGSEECFDSGAPVRSKALQRASGLSIRYSVSPYAESSGRGAACCNLESVVQSPLLLAMDDSSRDARRVPSTARQCSVEPCWLRQLCRPVSYCSHFSLGPDLGPSVCGSAQPMASTTQPAACRRLLGARLVAKHSKSPTTTWQVHDTDPIAPGAPGFGPDVVAGDDTSGLKTSRGDPLVRRERVRYGLHQHCEIRESRIIEEVESGDCGNYEYEGGTAS